HWRLSRSKINLSLECPRCFYLDNKLGVKRPPGFPFNLNKAVDQLLKQEFDQHRAKGIQHPLQKAYGLTCRPVAHDKLDVWRENFQGVEYHDAKTGLTISGAIDDLWINDATQEYVVVDYKATAKEAPVTELNDTWHDGYKRQMEVYQWLLRKNGLPVSDVGYFVYCTGRMDEKAFDAQLKFDVHLIAYAGNDAWIDKTLVNVKSCLDNAQTPKAGEACDYCAYREATRSLEH
ncbi:PD-(D/E)XK nuclease family protein, partial [Candidatus Uhrbacteria bacterium]|nr:PD-(D/E)XK nuclease family protein [Candidatus Uhrbacteria bacterium]